MPLTHDEQILLKKVAEFVKLATSEIDTLESAQLELQKKAAAEAAKQERFLASLHKAATALYDSDFLTDDSERKKFLRKAAEDPSYLTSVIIKVCNAADVSLIGAPARLAVRMKQGEEFDPVKARAFGWDYSGNPASLLEDT